jgi:hypothetical protein
MKSAILTLLLTGLVWAQDLSLGKLHAELNHADVLRSYKKPVLTRTLLGEREVYYIARTLLLERPLTDLWEPVYCVTFDASSGRFKRAVGRQATWKGQTIEFRDTQERVGKLWGPPAVISNTDEMDSWRYDAADRRSHVVVYFPRPGLGVAYITLSRSRE